MKKGGVGQLAVLVLLALALAFFALAPSQGLTGLQTAEENALPVYSGASFNSSSLEPSILNLSEHFTDPEGSSLSFTTTTFGARIEGDSLIVEPNVPSVEVVVSDGANTLYKLIEFNGANEGRVAASEPELAPASVPVAAPSRSTSGSRSTQAACSSSITTCCEITSTGVFTLANNILHSGTCIDIQGANVTLDCAGFNISGTAPNSFSVSIQLARNVTVFNCNLQNHSQFLLSTVNDTVIFNSTTNSTGQSVYASNFRNVSVENSTFYSNSTSAITFAGASQDARVFNVSAVTNTSGIGGVLEFQGGDDSVVINSSFSSENDAIGIHFNGGNRIVVVNSSVNSSTGDGVRFVGSFNITLNNVSAYSRTQQGIDLSTSGHRIYNSTLRSNSSEAALAGGTSVIFDSSSFESFSGNAVRLTSTLNVFTNSTMRSNTTASVFLQTSSAHSNNFTNNTVLAPLNAVRVESGARNNTFVQNYITGSSFGAMIFNDGFGNYFFNNIVYGNTTGGAMLDNSHNNTFIQNRFFSPTGDGIEAQGWNNTFVNNSFVAVGTGFSMALYVGSAFNNSFRGNYLAHNVTALYVAGGGANNSFTNETMESNRTWIEFQGFNVNFTFYNITFNESAGSVLLANFTTNASVNRSVVNTTGSIAFVNSSSSPFLNSSGQIVLRGIAFNDPRPSVDLDDDGTFANCDSPQCTEISYAGGAFVFNVSSFTRYTASEAFNGSVNASVNLTASLSASGTAVYFDTDNVTLDCKGFTIFFGSAGGSGQPGVRASSRQNVTLQNCVIQDTNESGSDSYGISFLSTNSSVITNVTVQTNGTSGATAVFLSNSFLNSISNSTLSTQGTADSNIGAWFFSGSQHNTLRGNVIRTNGTISNNGVGVESGSNNNTIVNNDIRTNGTSTSNVGIRIDTNNETSIVNNTIQTNGTSSNTGILMVFASRVLIENNTVRSNGTSTNNIGIYFNIARNSTARGNAVETNGTTDGHGFRVQDSANILVSDNNITTGGTGSNYGLYVQQRAENNTFANNSVLTALGNSNDGIVLTLSSRFNLFANNTVRVSSSSTVSGLIVSESNFNNFSNNLVNVSGSSLSNSIVSFSFSNNTVFRNNVFQSNGTDAVLISSAANSSFDNNTIYARANWIQTGSDGLDTQISNTTFADALNGSILVINSSVIPGTTIVDLIKLFIRNNSAFLNSSLLSFLNQSAQVTLRNLEFVNPRPLVDFEDDGTFVSCASPQCNEISYLGGVYVFNVSSFTRYTAAEGGFNGTVNQSVNLTENFTANGTAVYFDADNVVLDCQGFTINYSVNGSRLGINATGRNNITIRNCVIVLGNRTATGSAHAVLFSNTNNSLVESSSVDVNANLIGLWLVNSVNNTVRNTTVVNGSQAIFVSNATGYGLLNNTVSGSNGIRLDSTRSSVVANNTLMGIGDAALNLFTGVHGNLFENNTAIGFNNVALQVQLSENNTFMNTNASNNPSGTSTPAVSVLSSSHGNEFINLTASSGNSSAFDASSVNDIRVVNSSLVSTSRAGLRAVGNNYSIVGVSGQSDSNNGFDFAGITNSTIANSSASGSAGILISSSSNNSFIDVAARSVGSASGVSLQAPSSNNTFIGLNATGGVGTTGIAFSVQVSETFVHNSSLMVNTGTAIDLGLSSADNNVFNGVVLHSNGTWLRDVAGAAGNTLSNVTFNGTNGSIFISSQVAIPQSSSVNRTNLNASLNRAFLNSSQISFLNQSARIEFGQVSFVIPRLRVDFEDDGSSVVCEAPQCVQVSYSGGRFVFNVSSFTSYTLEETGLNVTLLKIDSPDPVNLSQTTLLNYTMTINVTDGNLTNATLNETYPSQVTFLSSSPSPSSGNNFFDLGNLTNGTVTTVNITVNVSSSVPNGTVINNTVNLSFLNSSGANRTIQVTEGTTILKNTAPSIAQVILNSSDGSGAAGNNASSNESLTVVIVNSTDADGMGVRNITDWRLNGSSIARVYWPFETNTSVVSAGGVRSYSSAGNNGTLGGGTAANVPVWNSSGKVGGAYTFDGANDRIDGVSGPVSVGTNYSVAFWVYPLDGSTNQGLVLNKDEFGIIFATGNLFFKDFNGITNRIKSDALYTTNEWQHFVLTRDSSLKMYRNGVLWASADDGSVFTQETDSSFRVGGRVSLALYFEGSMDELYVFNRSLTPGQIYQLYLDNNNSKHLETLHFNETVVGDNWSAAVTPNDNAPNTDGETRFSNDVTIVGAAPSIAQVILNSTDGSGASGNNASDSENLNVVIINATDADNEGVRNITDWRLNGTSIAVLNLPFETNSSSVVSQAIRSYSTVQKNATLGSGVVSAAPVWNSSGQVGGAYTFDGVDDFINVSGPPTFGQAVTVEAWILRTAAFVNGDGIGYGIAPDAISNYGWIMHPDAAGTVRFIVSDGSTNAQAASTSVVAANTWVHIAGTYDGGMVRFYFNGTQEGNTTFVGSILNVAGAGIELGKDPRYPTSRFLTGSLDEVRVYNRTLSPSQINQSYQDGLTRRSAGTIVSAETSVGNVWSVAVTPNDNAPNTDGSTVLSNNVTILADPLFNGTVVLNASQAANTSTENITANLNVSSGVKKFTNWYLTDSEVSNKSLLLVNMPMDGGTLASLSRVKDYSSNAFHATVTGATYSSSGGFDGKGTYSFDGSADTLTFPQNITFSQQDNWTITFWAQKSADGNNGGTVGKQNGGSVTDTIWLLSTLIEFRNNTVGTNGADWQFFFDPNTTRNHYAFVANSHRLEMYVNGTFYSAIDAGTGFTLDGFGRFNSASFDFAGTMDEVTVWNTSLTPSQIRWLFDNDTISFHSSMTDVGDLLVSDVTPNNNILDDTTQTSNSVTIVEGDIFNRTSTVFNSSVGLNTSVENLTLNVSYSSNVSQVFNYYRNGSPILAAYYSFDTEENEVRDYSGNGRDGLRAKLVTRAPTSGYNGRGALNFGGSDDYVKVPSMSWASNEPWSVSFWAQKDADNAQGNVIGTFALADTIWLLDTVIEFRNSTVALNGAEWQFSFDANTSRNFYTFVASGKNRLELYVNGTFYDAIGVGTAFSIDNIGDSESTFSFDGVLDEVAIWNTSLTPSQVQALYLNRTDLLLSSMTAPTDVWQIRSRPNDNFSDGNLTIPSTLTVVEGDTFGFVSTSLNGSPLNSTNANLTAVFNYTFGVDSNVNWYRNGQSLTLLNVPFDVEQWPGRDYANNRTLDVFSDVVWEPVAGVDGKGQLRFDGSNDYISVPQITLLGSQPWTITVWAKKDADGSNGGFVGTTNGVTDFISIRSTDVEFRNSTVGGGGPTFAFDANTSLHFYAFRAGGNGSLELFVNGSRVGAVTMGTNFTINNIGAAVAGTGEDFDGTLDEFVLWNRSLSQQQIQNIFNNQSLTLSANETELGDTWQACAVPNDRIADGQQRCTNSFTIADVNSAPSIAQVILNSSDGSGDAGNNASTDENLTVVIINATDADNDAVQNITDWRVNGTSIAVLNLPFETNSSSTVVGAIKDYSTFVNNGTLGNGSSGAVPVWNSSGKVGGAYTFDGVDDSIVINSSSSLNISGAMSFSFWGYSANWDFGSSRMLQKGNVSGERGFGCAAGTGIIDCWVQLVNGTEIVKSMTVPSANTWHHVAVTYDGVVGLNIYRNGSLITGSSPNSAYGSLSNQLAIGNRPGSTDRAWNGTIDEVLVFNRQLSSEEVARMFLDGNSSRHVETFLGDETTVGDIWSVAVTPNDNAPNTDGSTVLSNNVTILDVDACPLVVSSSATLTANLTCPHTAVQVTGDNLSVDCAGFTVSFANESSSAGVNISGRSNVTVRNCVLVGLNSSLSSIGVNIDASSDTFVLNTSMTGATGVQYSFPSSNSVVANSSFGTAGHGIFSSGVTNLLVNNSIFVGSGTFSSGVTLSSSPSVLIDNSTISGVGSSGFGISLSGGERNITVRNVSLSGAGDIISITGGAINITIINVSSSSSGLRALNAEGAHNITVKDSVLRSTTNAGLRFQGSSNNTVINNTIDSLLGIRLASNQNNSVLNNTVVASSNAALQMVLTNLNFIANNSFVSLTDNGAQIQGNNSVFFNNTFRAVSGNAINPQGNNNTFYLTTASVNTGRALRFDISANNTFENLTLQTNGTWILTDGTSFNNTLRNVTFDSLNGSIAIPLNVTVPNATAVNVTHLNVTFVRAILTGANASFLNTSAVVTFRGLTTATAQAVVDLEDDGSFVSCPSSRCAFVSYAGGVLVFTVTGFTSYSSSDGGVNLTLTKTDAPDPINLSNTTLLNYTITVNVTSGVAFNLTVNETYDGNVSFVNSTPSPTTSNFSWFAGNVTNGSIFQVNVTVNVSNITNGSIIFNTVNVTFENSTGSSFQVNVTENTTVLSDVQAVQCPLNITTSTILTDNVTCPATAIQVQASDVVLDCNGFIVTYDTGGSGGSGITASSRNNLTIRNCIIRDSNSSGSTGVGISLITVTNSTVVNNSVQTNGTDTNYGIELQSSSNNNTIQNNTVNTQGANSNYGIRVFSASFGNFVRQNTIRTNGTSGNIGVRLESSANNNTVLNNVIQTQGTGINNAGIHVVSSSSGNVLGNNTIRTNGTNANSGIFLQSSANNNTVANNTILTNGTGASNYGIHFFTSISGNNVFNNTIVTSGTSDNSGMHLQTASNNTIRNNSILAQGSSSGNNGLFLFTSSVSNVVSDNVILTNGTSSNRGIRLQTDSANNTISNNTITAGGTSSSEAIYLETSANNNTFIDNVLTTQATSSYAVRIFTSNGSSFSGTVLNNPIEWLASGSDTLNNFTNTTFNSTNGSIFVFAFSLANTTDVLRQHLNTSLNQSFLNSSNLSFLNTSAQITLRGLAFTDPRPLVDFEDDGTFALCGSPQCVEDSYSGGVFVMNVSSFTSYSTQESPFCPLNITTSTVLTENVTCPATAINILSDNVTLDCNGFAVRWNQNGASSTFGVLATGRINVTVRNCLLFDVNVSGATAAGIYYNRTNQSSIVNVTVQANGTSENSGVMFESSSANALENSFVNLAGTGSLNDGVRVLRSVNNSVRNSTVSVSAVLFDNGIELEANSEGNNLTFNTVTITGGNTQRVVRLTNNASANLIAHNILIIQGTSNQFGILLRENSSGNTVQNNTFTVTGTTNANSVSLQDSAHNNSFLQNSLNSTGTTGFEANIAASNGTVFVDSVLIEGDWITIDSQSGANFSNTTFQTGNGSIRINGSFALNSTSLSVTGTALNVSFNNSFLNSSSVSALNASAQITLRGLTFTDPRPLVDFEDDGTFALCSSSQCVEDSYAGGVFVMNVSSFTSYSTQESPFCPLNITTSTVLTENVTCPVNAINVLSDNVVLNCAGFNVSYGTNGSGIGINVTGRNNVTVGNCTVRGNATAILSDGVLFSGASNSSLINSSVRASGLASRGIAVVSGSSNITLLNNTGVSVSSIGIILLTSVNNVVINNTAIGESFAGLLLQTNANDNVVSGNNASGTSIGFFIGGSRNNIVSNNTFTGNNLSGIGVQSVSLAILSYNNTFVNNTAITNTGSAVLLGTAPSATDSPVNNSFSNTTLVTNGTWILSDSASNLNTFNVTVFSASLGEILIVPFVTAPNETNVSLSNLNISLNNSFLNSTNLSFFNVSARISLNSLAFANPRPVVDFDDDGAFVNCDPPQCVEDSYSGGVFVFNVSSFTSYATAETNDIFVNITFDKIDGSDPVTSGGSLTYTIQINNTGNGTASNLTVLESYPSGVAFVSSSPVGVDNSTFNLGSLGPGSSTTLNITVTVNAAGGSILNNSINLSFFNGSDTINATDSELTNVTAAPSPSVPSGGGGGGGAAFTRNVPIIRNETPIPVLPQFPIAQVAPKEQVQELPVEEEIVEPVQESIEQVQIPVNEVAVSSAFRSRMSELLNSAKNFLSRVWAYVKQFYNSAVSKLESFKAGLDVRAATGAILFLAVIILLAAFVSSRGKQPPKPSVPEYELNMRALRADLKAVDDLLKKHGPRKRR